MLLTAETSQLLMVDVQTRLVPALHEGQAMVRNIERLAGLARRLQVPVYASEQNPEGLGATVETLQGQVDRTLAKRSFNAAQAPLLRLLQGASAGAGTAALPAHSAGHPTQPRGNARSLPKQVRDRAASQSALQTDSREAVVLVGCEAHVCVLQTAVGLVEEEFDVWVVTDACSARTERNRDAAYDRLAALGVELVTTEMVLFEWLGDCDHPEFRWMQSQIK